LPCKCIYLSTRFLCFSTFLIASQKETENGLNRHKTYLVVNSAK